MAYRTFMSTEGGRMTQWSVQDQDAAWQAVLGRDRSWDGILFYAVRTTGIYCRPSCPSRRPRRENAVFFGSAEDAEAAGYRACHRCHPDSSTGTPTEHRVQKALDYLNQHLSDRVTLEELGDAVGLSPFHLQRVFKDAVGLSPHAYQNARRLEMLKKHLQDGSKVGRAVWRAGFGSVRGAYQSAGSGLGMTPGQYREGGRGVVITYTVHRTAFGRLIAAWTERGVCAVMLGDSADQLIEDLKAEFPGAEVGEAAGEAKAWIDALLRYLEGEHPGLSIPVDLHGTTFQLRVWNALREIPPGEVRSYRQIAEAIGAPNASRAVARACATNKTALVVPCHRVVRSDGSLSGYRWGEERKQELLSLERRMRDRGESE